MTRVLTGQRGYAQANESYWLYLLRQCREHHWRRRQKLFSFKAMADWEQHCQSVRTRFRAALGPMPERTPLNPRLVGVLERDGYVIEKLLIESQPNFFVTVNLYLPTHVRFPVPAVLNPLGHWANSKAEDLVQARGIGLARKGYVALIYDPIGQGERSQYWDAATDSIPIPLACPQHSAICNPCFLIGQTVINHMVWDGVRMLDYLESRPEVDASRIGCTGASGGGTYTMFITAFDPRIKASVPVCSTSTYERMLAQNQIGEPCQDPIASYRDDLDMADLLMCAAPTAVGIIATTYDFFPLIGAREVYLDLKSCYSALGTPERADLLEIPTRHDYNKQMREAMYAWFNRWLGNEGADEIEPPYQPESPETLWCTTTGQLLSSVGGETVISINRARSRVVAAPVPLLETSSDAESHRAHVRKAVPDVLNYVGGSAFSTGKILDRTNLDDLTIEQVVFESEPDLPIPSIVFVPPGSGPHPTILFLHDRGKDIEAGLDGLIPALARTGCLVIAVDLRGWGETAWQHGAQFDSDDFGLLGNESLLADVCYLLGTWTLTQRVADTIRTLDVFANRSDVDPTRIGVVGRGGGALVAFHAAILDRRIKKIAAYEVLATYRSIVEADLYTHTVSAFIPGVLLQYDLPDLVGALTPVTTLVVNPLDATEELLDQKAIQIAYERSSRMYELLGHVSDLKVQTELTRSQLMEQLIIWASGMISSLQVKFVQKKQQNATHRTGSKYEARNPKFETISKCPKSETSRPFLFRTFEH